VFVNTIGNVYIERLQCRPMQDSNWITESQERRESFQHGPFHFLRIIPLLVSVIALALVIFDSGFIQENELQDRISNGYVLFNILAFLFLLIRQVLFFQPNRIHVWLFVLFFIGFLREFSALKIEFRRSAISPAMLFLISFLSIILIGAVSLMLPTATLSGISFIDALFTSTSAVCVTGLVIADTATYFTPIGHLIIIFLIQIGGLGIMTFTSYFSYYFRGESSYENQLMIQEMTGTNKIAEVFGTLKRVLLLTFIIEALGAIVL